MGVEHMTQKQPIELDKFQRQTVVFPSLKLTWPEIKEFESGKDAVYVFKLGNTQMQKALQIFVCDGYVTEHVRIIQTLSKMYKQLTVFETDADRAYALLKRRCDMLSKIK
jgi:hypothetical protein